MNLDKLFAEALNAPKLKPKQKPKPKTEKSRYTKTTAELIRRNAKTPLNPGTTEPTKVIASYRKDICTNCRGENFTLTSFCVIRQNIHGKPFPYAEPITLSTYEIAYKDLPFRIATHEHWTPLCRTCAEGFVK